MEKQDGAGRGGRLTSRFHGGWGTGSRIQESVAETERPWASLLPLASASLLTITPTCELEVSGELVC